MTKQVKSIQGPAFVLKNVNKHSLYLYFVLFSQFFIYVSKFIFKYCEKWRLTMKAASVFQPDPENTCIIFKFIWILFYAWAFFIYIFKILKLSDFF